ncbi:hypothetical protein QE429_002690 [Bacillus sp. SORGH_AS 510]|nr:hypothetical protein [Bacillus sp. SORGH_AS_0510]
MEYLKNSDVKRGKKPAAFLKGWLSLLQFKLYYYYVKYKFDVIKEGF